MHFAVTFCHVFLTGIKPPIPDVWNAVDNPPKVDMEPLHKFCGLLATTAIATAAGWIQAVQPHIALIAGIFAALGSLFYFLGLFMDYRHKRRLDLRELEDEELRRQDAVCAQRRKTGFCPRSDSTNKPPKP